MNNLDEKAGPAGGVNQAGMLSYDEHGTDLVRTLQILQEGLGPGDGGWSWEPEHVAAASSTIDESTANRYSNRLAEDGLVTIDPEGGRSRDGFLPRRHTYALTMKGANFARALLYRYSKTIKTDVFAYGCPPEDVIAAAYDRHLGIDLESLEHEYGKVNRAASGAPVTLQRLHFPPEVYEQYGI
jgi:DNA-binding PadR family transcriptional regulator